MESYFEINGLSSNQILNSKQMVQLSLFHLSTPHTSNQLHNVDSSRWSNDKQIHTGHPTLSGVEPQIGTDVTHTALKMFLFQSFQPCAIQ